MSRVRIRPLRDYEELSACVELQKKTWGARFDDIVSAALMLVAQKIGGIASGAFDEDEDLVGIIFGLTGVRGDRRVHWSHMLAVEPTHQGKGLGRILKHYQRERVRGLGVRVMYWTFDPLEARNAHFNLNVLKGHVDEYVVDIYGSGESSPLHRGLGTDRLVIRWDLENPSLKSEAEQVRWEDEEAIADLPVESQDAPVFLDDDSESHSLVEIPSNIQQLKASDATEAAEWRIATRAAFTHYLSRGYHVVGFGRHPDSGASFYVLEKGDR